MDKSMLTQLLDETPQERQETADAVAELLEERYGEAPVSLKVLKESRPELFSAQGLKLLSGAPSLDPKTAELISLAAAAVARNRQSFQEHANRALSLGVSHQQVLDAVVIATMMSEMAAQSVVFDEYLQLADTQPQAASLPVIATDGARRRPGRPRTYRDRETFWEALVQDFKRRLPRATVSGSGNSRIRSVRLGRGQEARLEWAFRRRDFCVQLVLNSSNPGDNDVRLRALEADRAALEKETGARLTFESGRGRQARVVAHYRGSSRLNEAMRDWAVETMNQFYATFRARLTPEKTS